MFRNIEQATAAAKRYVPEDVVEKALSYLIEDIGIELGAPGEKIPIGGSKVSGSPDLPVDVEWPMNEFDTPLAFVAQINLDEFTNAVGAVSKASNLPIDGILSFFWDPVAKYLGEVASEACRVLYFENRDLQTRDFPKDKMPKGRTFSFGDPSKFAIKPQSMNFYNGLLTPIDDIEIPEFDEKLGDLEDPDHPMADNMEEFRAFLYGPDDDEPEYWMRFRTLGVPLSIQHDPRDDAAYFIKGEPSDWVLLLQAPLDMWKFTGYEGDLYFMIHRDDLANGNFSNVVVLNVAT